MISTVRQRISPAIKFLITIILFLLYIAVFPFVYSLSGEVATMLGLIPVCVSAWMWGTKMGGLLSLLTIPSNGYLFSIVGILDKKSFTDGIPAFIITILVALAVGWLSDLSLKYKVLAGRYLIKQKELENEIFQKQRAETELSCANTRLEELVQKRTEELLKAKNRAEEADRLKSEFLAQISHEIRTPINTILNYFSLIREITGKSDNEDLSFSFNAIDSSSRRLIRTIDLLLNVSQLQTGKLEYSIRNIDLQKEILEPVINEMRNSAAVKGLNLHFIHNGHLPVISGDEYTLTQIFINLIDNAVKYTKQGEISVKLYSENGATNVDVADTGIGISEEFIPHIFESFAQEEHGYTRRYEGNGLGLALVKGYCELNNAHVKVISRKGEGTRFTVTFQNTPLLNN